MGSTLEALLWTKVSEHKLPRNKENRAYTETSQEKKGKENLLVYYCIKKKGGGGGM